MHEAGDAKRDDERLHILGHCLVFRVQFSLLVDLSLVSLVLRLDILGHRQVFRVSSSGFRVSS
jgi:hypothetical protein